MKKLLFLAGMLVTLTAAAQNTYNYKRIEQDNIAGNKSVPKTVAGPGTIYIGPKLIKVSDLHAGKDVYRAVYSIIKKNAPEPADENYKLVELRIIGIGDGISMKSIPCFLLYNPSGKLTDVIFKLSKTRQLTYIIQ